VVLPSQIKENEKQINSLKKTIREKEDMIELDQNIKENFKKIESDYN